MYIVNGVGLLHSPIAAHPPAIVESIVSPSLVPISRLG